MIISKIKRYSVEKNFSEKKELLYETRMIKKVIKDLSRKNCWRMKEKKTTKNTIKKTINSPAIFFFFVVSFFVRGMNTMS